MCINLFASPVTKKNVNNLNVIGIENVVNCKWILFKRKQVSIPRGKSTRLLAPSKNERNISNKYSVHGHFDFIIYSTIRTMLSPFHSFNIDRLMVYITYDSRSQEEYNEGILSAVNHQWVDFSSSILITIRLNYDFKYINRQ